MDSLPLLKIKFENYTTAFKKFREKKVGGISCLSSQQNHYYPLVFCSYDFCYACFQNVVIFLVCIKFISFLFHLTFASEAFPLHFDILFLIIALKGLHQGDLQEYALTRILLLVVSDTKYLRCPWYS